jgi:hypothetical protein
MLSMAKRRRPLGLRIDCVDGVPVAWLDIDRHPVWRVSCCLTAKGRRPVLRELRVLPKPGVPLPQGGLPPGVVRLPRFEGARPSESGFASVLDFIVRAIGAYWAPAGSRIRPGLRGLERAFPFMVGGEAPKRRARADRPAPRRGRRPLTDDALLRVAVAYVAALDSGSNQPVQDAAGRLGKSPERIRDHVHKARRRDLLTFPLHGRAGGQLTQKAKALLKKQSRKTLSTEARSPRR